MYADRFSQDVEVRRMHRVETIARLALGGDGAFASQDHEPERAALHRYGDRLVMRLSSGTARPRSPF